MKIGESSIADIQQYSGTINQTAVDAETRSFQNQISNAQTQLQKLSADRNMSPEEKADKRQEIQKQIVELNNMLREHKMEMRKEKQQQAAEEASKSNEQQKKQKQDGKETPSDTLVAEEKPQMTETAGVSSKHMKSLVAADSAVSKAKTQESVANNLKSRVRILEGEVHQAIQTGGYVDAKKNEIESLEEKVEKISGSKMNILNSAIKEVKQLSEEENKKGSKSSNGKGDIAREPADLPSKDFVTKKQVDMYTKGKMFSNIDIHF